VTPQKCRGYTVIAHCQPTHRPMHTLRSVLLAAITLTACSGPLEPDAVVAPPCTTPASLTGAYDPLAPGYLVLFTSGVSAPQESARLAKRYGFTVSHVFEELGGFAAEMKPGVVAQLRCQRTVAAVSRDGSTTLVALPSPTP
jgi:hypothetical protein